MCLKVQNDKKPNQSQACPTHFDHCHDLFRGELSINQAIFTWEQRSLVICVEFLTKLMLNGETNLTCISITTQCNQYVAMVINHWYLCHVM